MKLPKIITCSFCKKKISKINKDLYLYFPNNKKKLFCSEVCIKDYQNKDNNMEIKVSTTNKEDFNLVCDNLLNLVKVVKFEKEIKVFCNHTQNKHQLELIIK